MNAKRNDPFARAGVGKQSKPSPENNSSPTRDPWSNPQDSSNQNSGFNPAQVQPGYAQPASGNYPNVQQPSEGQGGYQGQGGSQGQGGYNPTSNDPDPTSTPDDTTVIPKINEQVFPTGDLDYDEPPRGDTYQKLNTYGDIHPQYDQTGELIDPPLPFFDQFRNPIQPLFRYSQDGCFINTNPQWDENGNLIDPNPTTDRYGNYISRPQITPKGDMIPAYNPAAVVQVEEEEPAKKSGNGALIAALIILLIVAIGSAGFMYLKLTYQDDNLEEGVNPPPSIQAPVDPNNPQPTAPEEPPVEEKPKEDQPPSVIKPPSTESEEGILKDIKDTLGDLKRQGQEAVGASGVKTSYNPKACEKARADNNLRGLWSCVQGGSEFGKSTGTVKVGTDTYFPAFNTGANMWQDKDPGIRTTSIGKMMANNYVIAPAEGRNYSIAFDRAGDIVGIYANSPEVFTEEELKIMQNGGGRLDRIQSKDPDLNGMVGVAFGKIHACQNSSVGCETYMAKVLEGTIDPVYTGPFSQ